MPNYTKRLMFDSLGIMAKCEASGNPYGKHAIRKIPFEKHLTECSVVDNKNVVDSLIPSGNVSTLSTIPYLNFQSKSLVMSHYSISFFLAWPISDHQSLGKTQNFPRESLLLNGFSLFFFFKFSWRVQIRCVHLSIG